MTTLEKAIETRSDALARAAGLTITRRGADALPEEAEGPPA